MAIWVVNTMVMEIGKGVEAEAMEVVVAIVSMGEVMVCSNPNKMQVGTL